MVGNGQSVKKKSNVGFIVFVVIILLILIAGAGVWFLKPFDLSSLGSMFGMAGTNDTANIEEKVGSSAGVPNGPNSAFPSGVVGGKVPAATAPSAPVATAPKPVTTSNTYTASDRSAVEDYLRQNINKILKSSGYVVDDVTFDGPDRAIVSYSKGSIARSAVATTRIDAAGKVVLTGFTVLTK